MPHLCNMTLEELSLWLHNQGFPSFHAKQIVEWVYQKGIVTWEQMTNLPKQLRDKLAEALPFPVLQQVRLISSADKETHKFLWKLSEGSLVESVLILSGGRRTVCISSQVGCPVRCAFCASGKQGFVRNLQAHEIVEQLVQINAWLAQSGERVTHVVFMGMGEPLKNYDPVVRSIRLMSDEQLFHLSQRRITVSTVGIIEGIKRLASEDLKVSLVLSLHAPDQNIRKKIIPYARQYPLDQLMAAMDEYASKTKRDITYEYTLIAGINDHPDHAFALAKLLRGRQCTVNLIPYNPVAGIKLKKPDRNSIKQFRAVLFGAKIVNTCRYTKGDDIAAACGQLALQQVASAA